jgi:hypothetical protein
MNQQMYICLVILPVCLYNPPSKNINTGIFPQATTPFPVSAKVIFARDDQTEDCLRTGGCKD